MLISVIIATYNSSNTIENTIKSIITQSNNNFEIIIVDCMSKDNTIQILKKYTQFISKLISEPDKGIADAWNKGIAVANGDFICLVNSDDELFYQNFSEIKKYYVDKEKNKTIYYGTTYFIKNNQIVGINNKCFEKDKLLFGFGFTHTSCFMSKEIYNIVGPFSTDIKIAIDTDFLIRAYKLGLKFKQTKYKVYMSRGGVSDKFFLKGYFEYLNILKNYNLFNVYVIYIFKFIFFSLKPIRKIKNSNWIKNKLRSLKHLLMFFNRKFYNLLFFKIFRRVYFILNQFEIHKTSSIIAPCIFYRSGNLKIDKNSCVNRNCLLDNRGIITIGKNVSIAHNVKIYTAGHEINSPYFEIKIKNVIIEDYVVIFSNCIISPGIVIQKGAVILAGAVIVKDVKAYEIWGGNPARKIGERNKNLNYKINYDFWLSL